MKRSMLFGVLAMFAVSALSVQNLNAQNDEKQSNNGKQTPGVTLQQQPKTDANANATEALNPSKPKPSPVKEDNTTAKVDDKNGQTPQKDAQEPAMRAMQPQQKEIQAKKEDKKNTPMIKTNKKNRPKKTKYNGEKIKNDAAVDNKEPNEKPNPNVKPENVKPSKPQMTKDKGAKIKNDATVDKKEPNEKPNPNVKPEPNVKPSKPQMTKDKGAKIKNDAKPNKQEANQNASDGKSKVNVTTDSNKTEQPNSVIGPKIKTQTDTKNGGKKGADN